jgi:hypothetical protein
VLQLSQEMALLLAVAAAAAAVAVAVAAVITAAEQQQWGSGSCSSGVNMVIGSPHSKICMKVRMLCIFCEFILRVRGESSDCVTGLFPLQTSSTTVVEHH